MKITQITATTPGQFDNKTGNTQSTTSYRVGQVLDARVLANSSQGQVSLRLGGVDVLASTTIPLQQNATLSVKVIQLQPQLLLQVLSAPVYNPLQDAKLNLLPKQAALAPLLAELIHKTATLPVATSQSALKSAGEVLMAALFGRNELKKPEGLQSAIKQSGLFLEAKLATLSVQNPALLSKDLKAALLRYLDTLAKTKQESSVVGQPRLPAQMGLSVDESLPPLKGRLPICHSAAKFQQVTDNVPDKYAVETLLKKLEGAVARLGLLQVATADNFDEGTRLWQLEIPLRHEERVETVSLSIEKEQKDSDENEEDSEDWAVNLSLDLPQLGALQSRINSDARGISTTFWTDSTETLALIESRLSELRANFERSGLKAHELNCHKGAQPKTTTAHRDVPPDRPLIDFQI